jgi:hypothetical protein
MVDGRCYAQFGDEDAMVMSYNDITELVRSFLGYAEPLLDCSRSVA